MQRPYACGNRFNPDFADLNHWTGHARHDKRFDIGARMMTQLFTPFPAHSAGRLLRALFALPAAASLTVLGGCSFRAPPPDGSGTIECTQVVGAASLRQADRRPAGRRRTNRGWRRDRQDRHGRP